MNIFITGRTSYIGSAAAEALLKAGHSVTIYDSLVTGYRAGSRVSAPRLVASSEKIRRELGWTPQHPDLTGIVASAWDWHRIHPNGYER